jgi:large subunit ribosomal protein L24
MMAQLTNPTTETITPKFRIRKGDTVKVISGKEKGKTGQVLEVDPEKQKVYIEKINLIKRHTKPSQKRRQGGIIEKEGPLHIAKVMLVCRGCGKATRTGMRILEDGKKMRYCKQCGEIVDKT